MPRLPHPPRSPPAPGLPPFAKLVPGGLELRLKVVPGASRTALAGVLGARLKVRVAAPPEGGKANRAVADLLSAWLGAPTRITAGLAHAEKTASVTGLHAFTAAQLATLA